MHKLAIPAILSLTLPLVGQAYLAGPVARTAPLVLPDPAVNTTVINTDGVDTITALDQCELRHIGNGIYRVAATVRLSLTTDTSMVTGTLDMTVNPPVWTPSQDVAPLNKSNTGVDEYQLSISSNGRIAVWDNYAASTYPNSGAAANTFVCTRASTSVPFNVNDVRAITNVGAGGVDPHIGEELANGNVMLYHIDFLVTNNAIVKAILDPVTGIMSGASTVADYTPTTFAGFNHSPFVHRDSTGKARAINFSQYAAGGTSHAVFSEGINNDGTPEIVIDGSSVNTPTQTNTWYNNPGLVGGSWHYTTSGATEPQLQEVTMLANATAVNGSVRIAAWSPARPLATNTDFFFSVVAIGLNAGWLSVTEYAIPPVLGNAYLFPSLGVLSFSLHDRYTGLVEWSFPVPTPSPGWVFDMQVFTLDTSNVSIHAGNNALLNI